MYGLRGAAVSVDTACSSSLVAAHFAAGQVAGGSSAGGITAGVGLILSPEPTAMFKAAGEAGAEGGVAGSCLVAMAHAATAVACVDIAMALRRSQHAKSTAFQAAAQAQQNAAQFLMR